MTPEMTDEEITEALTHKCKFCDAKPGDECTSTINLGRPLRDEPRGAVVHLYRKDCK